MMRSEKMKKLYQQIHRCDRCFDDPGCKLKPDSQRVSRKLMEIALKSKVFLVGQALGSRTQRLTGLPYTLTDGSLSQTGQALDAFLDGFCCTVDHRKRAGYVYSSDMVQCYPGQGRGGDRKPTRQELWNCLPWMMEEMNIIQPKIIVLLGRLAAKTFFKKYLDLKFDGKEMWGRQYQFGEIKVFAVPHPSYRRRKPEEVDRIYKMAANKIKTTLL